MRTILLNEHNDPFFSPYTHLTPFVSRSLSRKNRARRKEKAVAISDDCNGFF